MLKLLQYKTAIKSTLPKHLEIVKYPIHVCCQKD